jgi:NADH dehydrogenase
VKVLVTGGTGFVGPKVVHALRAAGHDVRALVRRRSRARQLEAWGCELVEGDMTESASLGRAAEGCEAVVHLVATITGPPEEFERVMSQGTSDLVTAAQVTGVRRFVLMSALGLSEQTKDLVPYYRGKWDMEQAVLGSTLEHVVMRPSFVFGRDGGTLPMFIRQVRWSPVTPIVGSGKSRLQPIWVEDVAGFFAPAVDLPAAVNRTFELGGPEAVTWNQLFRRIKRVLGARRGTIHLPFRLVRAGATVAERMPNPLVTRDQLTMLERSGDNVCDIGPAVEAFGIEPIGLDEQLRRAT